MNEFEKKIAQLEALAELTTQLEQDIDWKIDAHKNGLNDKEIYLANNPDATPEEDWRLRDKLCSLEKQEIKIETLKLVKSTLMKMADIK